MSFINERKKNLWAQLALPRKRFSGINQAPNQRLVFPFYGHSISSSSFSDSSTLTGWLSGSSFTSERRIFGLNSPSGSIKSPYSTPGFSFLWSFSSRRAFVYSGTLHFRPSGRVCFYRGSLPENAGKRLTWDSNP